MVKIFDKYFQDQLDFAMNRYDFERKTSINTISMFEDFMKGDSNMNQK